MDVAQIGAVYAFIGAVTGVLLARFFTTLSSWILESILGRIKIKKVNCGVHQERWLGKWKFLPRSLKMRMQVQPAVGPCPKCIEMQKLKKGGSHD